MKTSTFPSLRVSPELRSDTENALQEGESLSAFMELAIRNQIEQRRLQNAFVAKAMASRARAKESGDYRPAAEVMDRLALKLKMAKG